MDSSELLKRLAPVLEQDKDYLYFQQMVIETEPAFLALREGLTEDQRQVLDAYIGACEALDDIRMWYAWQLGR